MPKIEFNPIQGFFDISIKPRPAKTDVSEWYKKMSVETLNMRHPVGLPMNTINNSSAKRCMPLLDSMTAGYYLYSFADVKVTNENGCSKLEWSIDEPVIENHSKAQVPGMPLPVGFYQDEAFKWMNHLSIKTPKGYSCLFVTPMLKHELPFWCFPGIVDTDVYKAAIHFPFLIRKNWEGIIPKGTPIIQVIPFKREEWSMKWSNKETDNNGAIRELKTMIYGAYKKMFWQKKYYI
jgi:hypothetical protein